MRNHGKKYTAARAQVENKPYPLADALPPADLTSKLQAVRDQVHGAVAAMPRHEDFLAQYCPAQKMAMVGKP